MTDLQPGAYVESKGDIPAVIMGESETVVTYRELDERSKRVAHLLKSAGLRPGDHVAILLENHPRYFEIFWGAQRAGLYTTPINWHLKAEEAGYIIKDSGATALFSSVAMENVARRLEPDLETASIRVLRTPSSSQPIS